MEVRVYDVTIEMNLGGANAVINAEVPALPAEVDAFRVLLEGLNANGDALKITVKI